jgi:hypothetical protein
VSAGLRLSALRAFLGRVHPEVRLVKIKRVGDEIQVDVVVACEPSERITEDVSEATTEIIADFPDANMIVGKFEISTGPLPREHVLENGWIYQRAE